MGTVWGKLGQLISLLSAPEGDLGGCSPGDFLLRVIRRIRRPLRDERADK